MRNIRKQIEQVKEETEKHEPVIAIVAASLMRLDKMQLARAVAFALYEDREFDPKTSLDDAEDVVRRLKGQEPS